MKLPDDTLAAVSFLGSALIVAVFHPVPPESHDIVLAFGSALAGFVAKQLKDAVFPPNPQSQQGPNP